MKKLIATFLAFSVPLSPMAAKEKISDHEKNTEEIYRTGAGAHDGAFTATAMSILGWGLGLGIVIGVLTAVLHSSNAGHHGHCD